MKIKKEFILTIEVDKNVSKKYPNYRFNYNNPEELIKSIVNDMKYSGDTDMSKDGLKKWGYSIKIKDL